MVAEYGGPGKPVSQLAMQFVYGDGLDSILVMDVEVSGDGDASGFGDQRFWYHTDALGSVVFLTDEMDNIVENYDYDAYGAFAVHVLGGLIDHGLDGDTVYSGTGNPYLFTGRRWDPESGLYHYRARAYDPLAGFFYQQDPIGVWGDELNFGNGYTYVGNNPVMRTDPSGEFLCAGLCILGGILAAAAIGAAVGAAKTYLEDKFTDADIDAHDYWTAAGIWGVAGALMVIPGVGWVASSAISGAAGAVEDYIDQAHDFNYDYSCVDKGRVGLSFVFGAVGGAVGRGVGQIAVRSMADDLVTFGGLTMKEATKAATRYVFTSAAGQIESLPNAGLRMLIYQGGAGLANYSEISFSSAFETCGFEP